MRLVGNRLVIENPLLAKRCSTLPTAFADMLLSETETSQDGNSRDVGRRLLQAIEAQGVVNGEGEALPVAAEEWIARGWQRSLEYFLWSERPNFADWSDADDSVRNDIMARVERDAGSAPERLPMPQGGTVVPLPPVEPPTRPVGELLMERRTVRHFDKSHPMSLGELSTVLQIGLYSVRDARSRALRLSGPAGTLETHGVGFEYFLIVYKVGDVAPGVWRLDLERNCLVQVGSGDHREEFVEIMCGMPAARTASATVVMVADFRQLQYRLRHDRALRSLYIEVGQIAQLMIIAGEDSGLGSLITPATNDRRLAECLGLPSERFAPVCTVTLGRKTARPR